MPRCDGFLHSRCSVSNAACGNGSRFLRELLLKEIAPRLARLDCWNPNSALHCVHRGAIISHAHD
jgi:hypothetical protein